MTIFQKPAFRYAGAALAGPSADGTAGQVLKTNGDGTTSFTDASGGIKPNLLINGCFRVSQRGATFTAATAYLNSDDKYTLDRWNLLSDGNDILDVSQESTTIPAGAYAAIKLDVETANKRAGIAQFVEARNARPAIGSTVSLSFKARKGASNSTVDALRVIIAAWSSTADAVTSDIISAWSTEGNNPTLATNWTIEGSDTFTLTDSYQTFTLEGVDIDTSSTTNIAVFLMIENGDGTVGDLVYIADVDLVVGETANPIFAPRHITTEISLCERYFYVLSSASEANQLFAIGQASTTTTGHCTIRFPVDMFRVPTASLSDVSHWAWVNAAFSLFEQWTAFGTNYIGTRGARISASGSSGSLVAGNATMLLSSGAGTSNARMYFDAEM